MSEEFDYQRTLPHNLEAEKGLLGSMLIAPALVIDDCIERITSTCFYQPIHATIYDLLVEMWNKQQPADVIILTDALRARKQLDAVGGPAYLSSLIGFTPTAANASHYLEIIREKYILREVIAVGTGCAAEAYEDRGEVNTLLDEAERRILAIRESAQQAQDERAMKDDVMEAIEALEKLYENKGAISGLSTGFKELDRMTNGLQPAEMIVIAARPSMGKTAFAMNIAEHVALEKKEPVAVFSLEMSRQQLVQRMICSRARINLSHARDGHLTERDFPNLTTAASKLRDSKIYIDDTPGLSINALRAKARRLKRRHDIKLVVIDYLQLMRSTTKRAQNDRQLEISEISNGVKALAKELNIPVIALAQLNRNPEARKGGKPKLSDLRESGSLEQDADLVGLLYRSEYYADDENEREELSGEAVLDIAKQRSGPVGPIELTFLKQYTRFEDRAKEPTPAKTASLPYKD